MNPKTTGMFDAFEKAGLQAGLDGIPHQAGRKRRIKMENKITNEQAKRLLNAIFPSRKRNTKKELIDDNYPESSPGKRSVTDMRLQFIGID